MPLWIFETETLRTMLADAKHVHDKNTGDVADEAALAYSAIRAELRSRNAL